MDCSPPSSSVRGILHDTISTIGVAVFAFCDNLKSVKIGNGVTSIPGSTFIGCSNLTSVEIGKGVTNIGTFAFEDCASLTNITIPESVAYIDSSAFDNCTKLSNITVDQNNPAYQSIDGNLYTKDGTTFIRYAMGKTATTFIIPNSVTNINRHAFNHCKNLTNIVIGNNVTYIAKYTFSQCTSLTTVYYKGTTGDWAKIPIDSPSNYYLTNATRYYYSETKPTASGNYWRYVDGVPTKW